MISTGALLKFRKNQGMLPINSPSSWHLYTATYDGISRKVYVDDTLVSSDPQTGTIASNNNSLTIGNQPGTGEWANASMDDIRIYNRVLSEAEIQEIYEGSPTLVELFFFEATAQDDSVVVKWETASEIDNVGFHLWRSTRKNGKYRRITEELMPAQGSAMMGAVYSYDDTDVLPSKRYFYKLEDIDINGVSTFHGPVKTRMRKTPSR